MEIKASNQITLTNDITARVVEAETQIEANKNQIALLATSTSEVKNDLEDYIETSETTFMLKSDGVSISVYEKAIGDIEDDSSELRGLYNELTTYYSFGDNGQYIGKSDSDTRLHLINDKMEILVADMAATKVDRTGLTASQASISTLHMGDFTFSVSSDGSTLTLT